MLRIFDNVVQCGPEDPVKFDRIAVSDDRGRRVRHNTWIAPPSIRLLIRDADARDRGVGRGWGLDVHFYPPHDIGGHESCCTDINVHTARFENRLS